MQICSSIGTFENDEHAQYMCSCWQFSAKQLICLSLHGNTSSKHKQDDISKRLSSLSSSFCM